MNHVESMITPSTRSTHAPPAPAALHLAYQTPLKSVTYALGFGTSLLAPADCPRRSRGCPAKSHGGGERPHKLPRAARLPPLPPPPLPTPPTPEARAAATYSGPSPIAPRCDDDRGILITEYNLPAPWKEPTDRGLRVRRGLPGK
jgi:hypothetical protein